MAEGYDGAELIRHLEEYLNPGASVLELGMGPGKDLDILNQTFQGTGSDASKVFIDIYREKNPGADLLLLNAVSLETDRSFDAIYSNKVLQHLTKAELTRSFQEQLRLLNPGGIVLHSFWYGEGSEINSGLLSMYYKMNELKAIIPDGFSILTSQRYTEMEKDDSFFIILKKS